MVCWSGGGGRIHRQDLCPQIQEMQTDRQAQQNREGEVRVSRVCARGEALLSGSPQPGRGRACWQAWCRNRADVRHLSWGTMGAHRRTNPERLPGGGSIRLKWKQRAGAVQVATKAKEVTEDPPPPCVSPHPTPTHCSPRMEKEKPCTGS